MKNNKMQKNVPDKYENDYRTKSVLKIHAFIVTHLLILVRFWTPHDEPNPFLYLNFKSENFRIFWRFGSEKSAKKVFFWHTPASQTPNLNTISHSSVQGRYIYFWAPLKITETLSGFHIFKI